MSKLPAPSEETKGIMFKWHKNRVESFEALCKRRGHSMAEGIRRLMQADLEQNLTDADIQAFARKDVRGKVLESLAPEIERLVDQAIAKVEVPNE